MLVTESQFLECHCSSGVARICIWRGLGARSATSTAGGADGAGGRDGGGSGRGRLSRKGGSGVLPPKNF
jgi:hypothetical protein